MSWTPRPPSVRSRLGWNDNMKRIRRAVRKHGRDFQQLEERSRPAMREDYRRRVWVLTAEMQVVNPKPVNDGEVVGILVQSSLLGTPVIMVKPVIGNRLHPFNVESVRPARVAHCIRPTSLAQTPMQILECLVRNGNREPLFCHVSLLTHVIALAV